MTTIANVSPAVSPCFLKVKIFGTVERTADFAAVETLRFEPSAKQITQDILENAAELDAGVITWEHFLAKQHDMWSFASAHGLHDSVGILLSRYNRNI